MDLCVANEFFFVLLLQLYEDLILFRQRKKRNPWIVRFIRLFVILYFLALCRIVSSIIWFTCTPHVTPPSKFFDQQQQQLYNVLSLFLSNGRVCTLSAWVCVCVCCLVARFTNLVNLGGSLVNNIMNVSLGIIKSTNDEIRQN